MKDALEWFVPVRQLRVAVTCAKLPRVGRMTTALAKTPYAGYVCPNWIYIGEAMTSSTVFTSNRSQAVRLPKAVAFPEGVHQVDILKIGRTRVIVPQGKRWDDLFQSGPRASKNFIVEREQPPAEEREPL
jgi:antitoxin VapB